VPEVHLAGCRSRPLASYLKGLGLLRVVASQADPGVRARWRAGVLELRSELDSADLASYLVDRYRPAPVLSPWNGRSGFYVRGGTSAIDAVAQIEDSSDSRLEGYRKLIAITRSILQDMGIHETPEGDRKAQLVRHLRRSWPDEAVEWLDAAIVSTGEGLAFPPVLGSGGNDGSYDFSSNYMQALASLLLGDPAASRSFVEAALFGVTAQMGTVKLGHLDRDAMSTNPPVGAPPSLGNPWDVVLAVEGTLILVAGASRRHGAAIGGMAVAPFTARRTAAGYGSAAAAESGKAELWLPLWPTWARHTEIVTLMREARADVASGGRRRPASSGLDFARACAELGVARGIDAFERYAILERAGQANLAVPVGRVSVEPRPAAAALRSIDGWLGRLLRRADSFPRSVQREARILERAAFRLATRGRSADACAVIEAIGAVEHALARSPGAADTGLRPLMGAPAAPWIEAANDGTPELAFAVAIASLRDRKPGLPGLRDYLHGTRDQGREYDDDRRHAVEGNSAAALLAAVHARRHLDAGRNGTGERRKLGFDLGYWCHMGAARMFAAGALDDSRILSLLLGFAVLDHRADGSVPSHDWGRGVAHPVFDVLALTWNLSVPGGEAGDVEWLGPRPGWAARLAAGATASVVRDAIFRLRLAGHRPLLRAEDVLSGALPGNRLAAALLPSFNPREVRKLERKLTLVKEPDHLEEEMEVT
jgi:CRISPR-associated protein Csx17